jgi:hypothetical protein
MRGRNMDQHPNGKLKKLKTISESVRRRTSLYSDLSKIDDKRTAQSLRALHKAPDPGRKIKKIGFIIFWFPEPTGITHAIGGPMILAGKYLEKVYNGSTIHDIATETKSATSSIHDFKQSVF